MPVLPLNGVQNAHVVAKMNRTSSLKKFWKALGTLLPDLRSLQLLGPSSYILDPFLEVYEPPNQDPLASSMQQYFSTLEVLVLEKMDLASDSEDSGMFGRLVSVLKKADMTTTLVRICTIRCTCAAPAGGGL